MNLQKIKKQFEKDGVVLVKNFFTFNQYEEIKKVFLKKLNFYSNQNLSVNNFNNLNLHKALEKLRKKNPKKFSNFYDSLQESNALSKLFINNRLERLVSYLINSKNFGLSISGKMLRMDSYFDNKSSYNWHQDFPYYLQNKNPSNGCVVFLPLHQIKKKHGALEMIKNSSKTKISKHYEDKKTKRLLIKRNKNLKHVKTDILEYDIGDVAIMHLALVHRSGKNSSNKFRLTAGARYHNLISKDFTPFRSSFKLSI